MPERRSVRRQPAPARALSLNDDWAEVFNGRALASLNAALQEWLPSRRWFRSKARKIESVNIREQIEVPMGQQEAFLVLFQIQYTEGGSELYVLPLACAFGQKAEEIIHDWPQLVLAEVSLERSRRKGVLYDAIISKEFCRALLALTSYRHTVAGQTGGLEAEPTGVMREVRRGQGLDMEPSVSKAEQSNSSIIYKGTLILKFFRRLDVGINPELEIERFLSARGFPHSPPLAGALEYRNNEDQSSTMAVVTSFVPGCQDAWGDTLRSLNHFYRKVQKLPAQDKGAPATADASISMFGHTKLPRKPADLIGSYLQDADTLGQRTAALHLALASDPVDPSFCPEPWTQAAQKILSGSLRDLTRHNFQLLRQRLTTLTPECQTLAGKVLPLESALLQRFERIAQQPFDAMRIRNHGDYHLGQVLHHGTDFLIIDFEGEPAISLEERRAKQSALRDVAGMIYSFFYAANAALRELQQNHKSPAQRENIAGWGRYWSVWVGAAFLRAYLKTARSAPFIPADEKALKVMLDAELLRKAIYELGYELNNRPDWLNISLQVLLDLLNPDNPI
ncbi:MAG TPA: putative maltokinase [Verrucomicrobiae bacterium]|nr:putative maltokinase [Verrucomicrobiae bacterium]